MPSVLTKRTTGPAPAEVSSTCAPFSPYRLSSPATEKSVRSMTERMAAASMESTRGCSSAGVTGKSEAGSVASRNCDFPAETSRRPFSASLTVTTSPAKTFATWKKLLASTATDPGVRTVAA